MPTRHQEPAWPDTLTKNLEYNEQNWVNLVWWLDITNSPPWAATNPAKPCSAPHPTTYDNLADIVYRTYRYVRNTNPGYTGPVYIELWNEPNVKEEDVEGENTKFFGCIGDGKVYRAMVEAVAEYIYQERGTSRQQLVLVAGALAQLQDEATKVTYFDEGFLKDFGYYDGPVSIHSYNGFVTPGYEPENWDRVWDWIQTASGYGTEVWVSEMALQCHSNPACGSQVAEEQKADFMRHFLSAWTLDHSENLAGAAWYTIGGNGHNFTDACPGPACEVLHSWFSGWFQANLTQPPPTGAYPSPLN
jgi:hypothetical protein